MIKESQENRMSKKSIMYKMMSVGFEVYNGDNDNFIINFLRCKNCHRSWRTWIQECYFCETEFFHFYECSVCHRRASITGSQPMCHHKKMDKMCINPDCMSNNDPDVIQLVNDDKVGGVFGDGEYSLNAMVCPDCGCTESEFITYEVELVDSLSDDESEGKILLVRNGDNFWSESQKGNDFDCSIEGNVFKSMTIEKIFEKVNE